MKHIQSFITCIAFPTSLDELFNYSGYFNMEDILGVMPDDLCETDGWTCPRWAKKNDIVFFYHAKTANNRISRLEKELHLHKDEYDEDEYWFMLNGLYRSKAIWREYGGKVFAVGRVSGKPERYERNDDSDYHWGSNIYAPIDGIFVLEKPIDYYELESHISLSRQGAITPVFGENYDFLKSLILKKNKHVRNYLIESVSQPIPLTKITKENWLSVTNPLRRSFFLEEQFRSYYVNYLLPLLGDKKQFFRECMCKKAGNKPTYVDNVIHFLGKYLPIEIKLNIKLEKDIISQLDQYMYVDEVKLLNEIVKGSEVLPYVLTIDTDNIYLYDGNDNKIIYSLDDLSDIDKVNEVKKRLKRRINNK